MKKMTLATAILSTLVAGTTLANTQVSPNLIDFDGIVDDVVVNGTGFEIGRHSSDESVRNFFAEGATPEQRQQASLEYAQKVIANGGQPLGDTDKFASKVDGDGKAHSAHDHIMADAMKTIRDSDEFKRLSDDEFRNQYGVSKSDIHAAEQHYYTQRTDSRKGAEANGQIVSDAVDRDDKAIDDSIARSKNNEKRINDEIKAGNSGAEQAQRAISNEFNAQTASIEQNKAAIADLRQDLMRQGEEMRERYDGVKASMHAITNARPSVTGVGDFAMGAGVGAAGSKQALAIGGAYRFNDSWSASFTTSYETKGKYTNEDFSAGVGAQFTFK